MLIVMRKLFKSFERLLLELLDCLLAVAGRRRVVLGDWPNGDVVEAALAALKELGAENLGAKPVNLALDVENLYFRVKGRRVRLWVEQYGDVTLWGPRAVVIELAARIAEKVASKRA
jgi:hypothetical protein